MPHNGRTRVTAGRVGAEGRARGEGRRRRSAATAMLRTWMMVIAKQSDVAARIGAVITIRLARGHDSVVSRAGHIDPRARVQGGLKRVNVFCHAVAMESPYRRRHVERARDQTS